MIAIHARKESAFERFLTCRENLRNWKTEGGERNSVKDAFELGKIHYSNPIQLSE